MTTVVLEVVGLGIVGIVVEGPARVVLEVMAFERVVPGIGTSEVVIGFEMVFVTGIDMVSVIVLESTFRQGRSGPWQAYPALQHEP